MGVQGAEIRLPNKRNVLDENMGNTSSVWIWKKIVTKIDEKNALATLVSPATAK